MDGQCVVTTMLSMLIMTCLFTACVHTHEDHRVAGSNTYNPSLEAGPEDARIQRRATAREIQYFMDSSTDCNNAVRTVSTDQIVVHGRSATQYGSPVIHCTLQLQLQNLQTAARLKIEVKKMDIRECDVKFTIFDGVGSQTKLVNGYACGGEVSHNERVVYSSEMSNGVTFVLERRSQENINYDIQLEVSVFRNDDDGSSIDPTSKFEQRYIVLIVGVFYGVLTIIVIVVFIISIKVMPGGSPGEVWNKAQLNNRAYVNQAFDASMMSHPPQRGHTGHALTLGEWVKDGRMNNGTGVKQTQPRNPIHVRKRIVESEDADSVFESDTDMVKNKPQHSATNTATDGRQKHQKIPNSNKTHATERGVTTRYSLTENTHPRAYHIEREIELPPKKKKLKRRMQKRGLYSGRSSSSSNSSEYESLSSGNDTDVETSIAVNNDNELTDNDTQHRIDLATDDDTNQIYTKSDKPVKQKRQINAQHTVNTHRKSLTPDKPTDQNQISDYPTSRTQTPDNLASRPPPVNDDYPISHSPKQRDYTHDPQQRDYPHDPQHTQRQMPNFANNIIEPPSYNVSRNMGSHQPVNYGVEQSHMEPPPYTTSTPPQHHRDLRLPQYNNRNPLTNVSGNSSTTSHPSMHNLDSGVELMKRHTEV